MNFEDLHELLRLELLRRIDRGVLTGTRLAQQSGFRPAHISNFLNKKRSLSLEGLDRVLSAQELKVEELLPIDLTAVAAVFGTATSTEMVPIVSSSAAMNEPQIDPSAITDTLHLSASRLADTRTSSAPNNVHWQRFVAVRADMQQAAAMDPMLVAGTVAVIDRHYNSLAPYRIRQPNLYAVRSGNALLLRFVDYDQGCLILRPASAFSPAQLLTLGADETPADYLVGRVCILFHEL